MDVHTPLKVHPHGKTILILVALLVVVAFGVIANGFTEKRVVQPPVPTVEVNPPSVDFGDVPQAGGIVSADVEVTNSGSQTLTIYRLSTSCGCTTATMDTSPIEPGGSRTLTIRFDPMAHPDQSGLITRVVYLQTSDAQRPEVEIDVTGNVIPAN
ncbi:MAG: DUF1573 domain-containing protein [Patescibacteria group bacterium]